MDHDSDHVPLETILAKPTYKRMIPEQWNWESTEKDQLLRVLVQNLPDLSTLAMAQDIDQATQAIIAAILTLVEESTPRSRPSPRSVPGWTRECKEVSNMRDA